MLSGAKHLALVPCFAQEEMELLSVMLSGAKHLIIKLFAPFRKTQLLNNTCHVERSETSDYQTLRSAQDDTPTQDHLSC